LLTNFLEPKYRSINLKGKAFKSVSEAAGAVDVLLFIGFRLEGEFLVLPAGREIKPEFLDFLLSIEDLRESEKRQREEKEQNAKKSSTDAKKKSLAEKIASDRIEASQKTVVASKSTLVPFSNRDKVGLKDIGAGDAAKQGG
jgi:hypothetical protein